MRFIVKCIPERMDSVEEMKSQIPELELAPDKIRNHMDTFLRSLIMAGEDAAVHLEDDVVLCDNFKEKILKEIRRKPNTLIQFFSMRKADLDIGSRYEPGRTFLMNQCVYYPKGYSKQIFEFYGSWDKKKEHPTGSDLMIADFLRANGLNYFIVIPNLVNHRVGKSFIGKRSSKRQSKTFEDKNA